MKFIELAKSLQLLEKITSRIEITKILAEIFKAADKNDIDKVTYLVLGRLAPSYKGIVFNLADRLMITAVARAYKREVNEVTAIYKQKGDLGDVVMEVAGAQKSDITVTVVYEQLMAIALDEGEGSVERKVLEMAKILAQLDKLSAKYVVRIPLGRLRLGFSDLTILDALSWYERGDKSGRAQLTRAYEVLPDIGLLAREVKEKGIERTTKTVKPKLGTPVIPALAQRIKSSEQMIEKMGKVAVEPKYDGVRVSIHFKRGVKAAAFTRNMNDVSEMFPELATLGKYTSSRELILDAEAVGIDPSKMVLLDFQTTMQRRRKHEITELATRIPLNFYIFDVLFVDGESVMGESYQKRREILAKIIKDTGPFKLTPYKLTEDPGEIRGLYTEYLGQGLEGVMVKKADSTYIPGRTGFRWVKMKQTEAASGKLSDTLDCVIMGYTQGQGKRVSFGVGQFLVGVRNGEKLVTITKVGTGLSDEQFRELKNRLDKVQTKEKPEEYEAHKDLTPDFWVKPKIVVELAGDDITISPKHTSGYALRFPRLVRFRDDKSVVQATNVNEVKKLFKLQKK